MQTAKALSSCMFHLKISNVPPSLTLPSDQAGLTAVRPAPRAYPEPVYRYRQYLMAHIVLLSKPQVKTLAPSVFSTPRPHSSFQGAVTFYPMTQRGRFQKGKSEALQAAESY